jgi:tRNA threonylcarbamoyladenosine biosynthesis protein TsaE
MHHENAARLRDARDLMIETHSPEETFGVGRRLADHLRSGMVVALVGDLGAGKTQIAKGIARGLNVQTCVDSPAFNIIHEYQGDLHLCHMDFYRLDALTPEDYYWLEEYLYADTVCIIEWADRFIEQILHEYLRIKITVGMEENTRYIRLMGIGIRYESIIDRM